VPLDPGLRAGGAQGCLRKADWLRSYRRSATGLAARRSGSGKWELAGNGAFPNGERKLSVKQLPAQNISSQKNNDAFAFHRRAETKGLQVRETNGIYD